MTVKVIRAKAHQKHGYRQELQAEVEASASRCIQIVLKSPLDSVL